MSTQLGDTPHLDKLIGPVKTLLDAYAEGKRRAVYLCYTQVHQHDASQEPVVEQLLPLTAETLETETGHHSWDYIYEPDAQSVIDELLVRYAGVAGVPGRGREHGVRALRAHGGHEGRDRQRR